MAASNIGNSFYQYPTIANHQFDTAFLQKSGHKTHFDHMHPYFGYSQGSLGKYSNVMGYLQNIRNYMTAQQFVNNTFENTHSFAYGPHTPNDLSDQSAMCLQDQGLTQMCAIQSLQDMCNMPGTSNTEMESAFGKVRSHPFYRRQRVEPVEGMTRTRDKYRVVYTEKQRNGLETEYSINKFITTERRTELSTELNLSHRQIKNWFQNRRAKERRDSRKSTDSNGKEDENDIFQSSSNSLVPTKIRSSCRFSGNQTKPETSILRIDVAQSEPQCSIFSQNRCTQDQNMSAKEILEEDLKSTRDRSHLSHSEWHTMQNHGFQQFESSISPFVNYGISQRL